MSDIQPDQLQVAIREQMRRRWKKTLQEREALIKRSGSRLRLIPAWTWAAAAVVLLALGLWWWLPGKEASKEQLFAQYFVALPNTITPDTRNAAGNDQLTTALRQYEAGQFQEAIHTMNLIAEAERPAGFYLYRGIALLATDQATPARSDFQLALEGPYRQSAQWYAALAAIKLGTQEEALESLETISTSKQHPFADQAASLLEDLRQ